MASARICCCFTMPADICVRGAVQAGLGAQQSPGMVLGSIGAFLVLEVRAHARARGAKPLARVDCSAFGTSRRPPAAVADALSQMWQKLAAQRKAGRLAIISGATGSGAGDRGGARVVQAMPDLPVRATGSKLGHGFEPQFAMNIAIATIVAGSRKVVPALGFSGVEQHYEGAVDQVAVTSVGHWRGEGIALVEAVK